MNQRAKTSKIMTNVEPFFYERMESLLRKKQQSMSAYLRELLIQDLERTGTISETELAQFTLNTL